jgi:acetylornithine deacetylase
MKLQLRSLDLLKKLISFDTTSCESNLELIRWAEFYLQQFGAETRLTLNSGGNKANLFATFKAHDGNGTEKGVIFSGHTDVVPVEGQDWKTNPFELHIGNGKAYGRGTSDMKGFIAIIMSFADQISRTKLKVPFHFALSFDEEVGCVGVRHLIDDYTKAKFNPAACIVGEPSLMQLVTGHKGQIAYKCEITGYAAHSSLTPMGVNAIEYAARLIAHIHQIARDIKDKKEAHETFFDPGYNTFNTGIISGGTALNIIPNFCEFLFEYRFRPGYENFDQVERIFDFAQNILVPEMKAVYDKADIQFTKLIEFPGFRNSEESELVKIVKSLTGANQVSSVPYGAEAGLFAENGIDSIICGPGSIEQAHKANEFITLDQLERGEKFMEKLIAYYTL